MTLWTLRLGLLFPHIFEQPTGSYLTHWVNISIVHILGFFCHFQSILFHFFFFFEHVVDEFWKKNPRLVLQETPRSLGVFCPLRWNFCPLWRNYRTLWWNHNVIPYIMAPHSMDFWNVEVVALRRNCTYNFCVRYEKGGCKFLHRDYDGTGTECEKGNSEA